MVKGENMPKEKMKIIKVELIKDNSDEFNETYKFFIEKKVNNIIKKSVNFVNIIYRPQWEEWEIDYGIVKYPILCEIVKIIESKQVN